MSCANRSQINQAHGLFRFGATLTRPVFALVLLWGMTLPASAQLGAVPGSVPETAPETAPETVLERIARTNRLLAGTRQDTAPFARRTESELTSGELTSGDGWEGYSIELIQRIHAELERQLDRSIQLEFVEVSIADRATQLKEGKVDIICDASSFTRSRDLEVDFSVGYFETGTQLLFNKAVETDEQTQLPYTEPALIIGTVAGTTNQAVVERQLQLAQFVEFPSRDAGWQALQRGRIDALASDGILLETLRQSDNNPENYEIAPDQPYDQEVYACMLPQDDPNFKTLVNDSLLDFMQGVLNNRPEDLEVLNTWFVSSVPTHHQPLRDLFQRQIDISLETPETSENPTDLP